MMKDLNFPAQIIKTMCNALPHDFLLQLMSGSRCFSFLVPMLKGLEKSFKKPVKSLMKFKGYKEQHKPASFILEGRSRMNWLILHL